MSQPTIQTDRPDPGASPALLDVRDLSVSFRLERSTVYAVQGLSVELNAGERLGVVGESGSGKSISALSIMADGAVPRTDHRRQDHLRGQ